AGHDLRRVREQGREVLPHEVGGDPRGLVGARAVLEDAGRDQHPVPRVDPVVGHEARDVADEGHEPLSHLASHLSRVGHPSYRLTTAYIETSLRAARST